LKLQNVLAVLAVLFLAPSVTEGVVLNKCELRNQMKMVLPANLLNSNELAKIVCHVQLTSGFNTSMVKSMNETEDEPSVSIHPSTKDHKMSGQTEHQEDDDDDDKGNHPGGRKSRSVKSVHIVPTKPSASNFTSNHTSTKDHKMAGQTEHQEDEEDDKGNHPRDYKMAGQTEHQEDDAEDKGNHPRGRKSRAVKSVHIDPTQPLVFNLLSNKTTSKEHRIAGQTKPHEDDGDKGNHLGSEEDEVWTFYGLFQLSDHVACVSGNNTSLNLCGMSCDSENGNISDDIDCVGTIIKTT
uniref:lysozyme n=1 Tax=Electrophorus electricus TaxID=8005 RepID=A0AAY5ETL8_ELEEL